MIIEEASIQTLLESIPSRASHFALECVGKILEDQIQDPTKMAKSLKRIGSVVSEWGLGLSREMDASGDAGPLFYGCNGTKRACKRDQAFINLPMKIRHHIMSYLTNRDLLNLRLVCSTVQFDIDIGVGLPVIMDTSCESIKWLQTITTRDCYVKNLDNFLYFNFLPKPERMRTIRFHEYISISSDMLNLVLRKFGSLQKITFHSQDLYEVVNGTEIKSIRPSTTSEYLSVLEKNSRLVGINLEFNEITLMTKWNLELTPRKNILSFPGTDKIPLKNVHIKIPHNQTNQQADCIKSLERQKNIFELRSELCGISWEHYTNVVNQTAETLTNLYLLNISSTGSPFDFRMLMNCSNLRLIFISGENNDNRTEEFSYLSMVEVRAVTLRNLQIVQLENVCISTVDYNFIRYEFSKAVCIKNSLCGEERVSEIRAGFGRRLQNSWSNGTTFNQMHDEMDDYDEYSENSDSESSDLELEGGNMGHHNYRNGSGRVARVKPSLGKFIHGIPAELLKGIVFTAWVAFC